jgi:glycosyltransferase involved in cell wall biosynthesis
MDSRAPLSVAIITLNEERNIARCVASVSWADEIVVVDAGSVDTTRDIARRHGARVVEMPWPGFVAQKNNAADAARHLWILSLDADEWLPPQAEDEIRASLEAPTHAAFALRRESAFSGGFLPHTWSPDRQVRLYRKDLARFAGGHVHESVRVDPPHTVGRLASPLFHLTHRNVHEQVERLNRYSTLSSRSAYESGRKAGAVRMIAGPIAAFLKMYVLKRGAQDGMRGLIAAVNHAHYVFLKSAKLWDRTRRPEAAFADRVRPTPEDPDPGAPYSG